eukprot:scaffold221150_cov19-Tisochrysis_lutea.AAC.1
MHAGSAQGGGYETECRAQPHCSLCMCRVPTLCNPCICVLQGLCKEVTAKLNAAPNLNARHAVMDATVLEMDENLLGPNLVKVRAAGCHCAVEVIEK